MSKQGPGIERIVSGGQTGVDRAALDAAIERGVDHGGWCPLGRRAEDGIIPGRYALQETDSAEYASRTEANVVDSDATLIICRGELTGGSELTCRLARRHAKPLLVFDLVKGTPPQVISDWLSQNRVGVLNIAGPRESTCPGIHDEARAVLSRSLSDLECSG